MKIETHLSIHTHVTVICNFLLMQWQNTDICWNGPMLQCYMVTVTVYPSILFHISVTNFFFSQSAKSGLSNRQSMRNFENCLKSCKVVTEFFLSVVGEGAEIFIFLRHLAEQLLCVDGDFRSFQKSFVNFRTCSLKNVVVSSIEFKFFRSFFPNFLVNSVSRCYFSITERWK